MTYYEEDNEVVPELTLRKNGGEITGNNNNNNGDYVKLRDFEEEGLGSPRRCSCRSLWFWFKLFSLFTCLVLLAGVFLKWVGPFFMDKGWLEKYPKKAAILRAAGEGNWFHQFRAVALIRISPFPYMIYNYCAVATNVKYGPYLLGSLVGMVPETFLTIYTGILIRTLADASHDRRTLSASQIVLNAVGFCATVATTIIITMYAKKQLKVLQTEEDLLLQ